MSVEFARVPLAQLSIGTVLTSPIFDPDQSNAKLLGKDVEIDANFLAKLEARGIHDVVVSKRDLAAIHSGTPQGVLRKTKDHSYSTSPKVTALSREVDSEIKAVDFSTEAADNQVQRLGEQRTDRYDEDHMSLEVKRREKQVEYVDDLFGKLVQGAGANTDELTDVCRQSVRSVVSDKDLFLCLGLNPFDADYPARHSLHVSTVAVAIGVVMGLDDDSLADLGTGCLIHDVGMLKLDKGLYKAKRRLTAHELTVLAEHPILTLDALACPGARISRVARIVAYQIHERCNGTGYPRGRTGDEIHGLAKIAAVADAYVGLVSNRSHRRGMLPYFAIEKILRDIPSGLYDQKAVRGLLNSMSLYPIGSFVEMDSGQIGRVVRSMGDNYMSPIVELWNAKHQEFEPDLLNLSAESDRRVVRAVPSPMAA
ncbi:MAG: HD-GYP domain-containing protein [Rubripirellula sp.]